MLQCFQEKENFHGTLRKRAAGAAETGRKRLGSLVCWRMCPGCAARGACDDIDITTNATPQEVMAVFGAENIIETGLAHGTVTVKPQMAEVTTYRTEGAYTDHRHPDQVTFVRSLREDLKRRDFTINADGDGLPGHSGRSFWRSGRFKKTV